MKKNVLKSILTIIKYGITLLIGILSGQEITDVIGNVL